MEPEISTTIARNQYYDSAGGSIVLARLISKDDIGIVTGAN